MKDFKKPEVLAPVQDFTTLTAAIQAGADAFFFGVRGFNMRVAAKNFTVEDLPKIMEVARAAEVKAYLALNIIVYEEELADVREVLVAAQAAGVDAVICWDLAVIEIAKEVGIEVHISTQASISNSVSANFYKKLGVTRVVLARECSLEQIKEIKKQTGLEIETFIHGAMCISVSGRCFLSQFSMCSSANRGECRQPCRREYIIKDTEGEFEYEIGTDYVLSPKDMCTLPFIEELVYAGIDSLKIEGRNKGAEYVFDVVSVYRKLVDFVWENLAQRDEEEFKQELAELKASLMPKLERVFNRGFSDGFYMGKPINEWAGVSGSAATEKKVHLGRVVKYYPKISVAEVAIQAGTTLALGEEVLFQGPHTGNYRTEVTSMQVEHEAIEEAKQGDIVAIKLDTPVRTNDVVMKIEARI
jgi:putative protease